MRCFPPVLAASLSLLALADPAAAQGVGGDRPAMVRASNAVATGVVGRVTDDLGRGIGGVSVLAMGATLAVARTDDRGTFRLSLAPGPYVLRATLDGYVSTYREAVQVRAGGPLTRHITLPRVDDAIGRDVVLASVEQPLAIETAEEPAPRASSPASGASASETAWRLRHLARSVLRDAAVTAWAVDEPAGPRAPGRLGGTLLDEGSAFGDVNGHVDFLTTSALTSWGAPSADDWPRGVAYVVLGAPVGAHGDWAVRAAMAGGEAAAWTFVGEYTSRDDRAHAFRTGVTYSAQTLPDATDLSMASIDTVRRVGGVYLADRWSLSRSLQVESSLRVDRYDYLEAPTLLSGRLGVRQAILPRVTVVAAAAPHMVAPGADQFMPPAEAGAWLPPERTFSTLDPDGALTPQRVQYYEVGADTTLRTGTAGEADVTLRVRRFDERTTDQIATLFGLDEASEVGHYYISSPGGVDVDGWIIGISGQMAPHVFASLDYSATSAVWTDTDGRALLRGAAPSAARRGSERQHDITGRVEANVPSTATRVSVAVRVNSGFSQRNWQTPGAGSRFAVEVRQQLPVRPFGRGELNLLLAARTLLHPIDAAGGFYDELLTVAPPVRLTCGLQMRF